MKDGISRRTFFLGTLLAGVVPRAGYGSMPSLRQLGFKSPNEKLNIACIGAGGRATSNINGCSSENIMAFADVDDVRAGETYTRFPNAAKFRDFRKMLDKDAKSIDAVIITTPDHLHASAAMACMQLGKHVYVEKPLTRTPWEADLLAQAAAKYKVATQMGNQGYSHESNRVAAEIVWSGEIGDVTEVHASTGAPSWPQGLESAPVPEKAPGTLDWDVWLGGAEARPYSPAYLPFNWRGFYDFGTGPLGDWGIHVFGPLNLALRLGAPVGVEVIRQQGKNAWTFPTRSILRYDFPARGSMPAVKVFWYDATRGATELYKVPGMENEVILPASNNLIERGRGRPTEGRGAAPAPGAAGAGAAAGAAGAAGGRGGRGAGGQGGGRGQAAAGAPTAAPMPATGVLHGNGAVFVGSKGYMATVARGEGVHLLPGSRWKDYSLPAEVLSRSPGHYRDWIRACKGGEPACSNFSVSGPFAEWVTLGAIAYRFDGKLEYDAAKKRFTNNDAANQFLKPKFRKGWETKL